MLKFNKRKQSIIIVLVILFLLGRIAGLHAHGHMGMDDMHIDHDTSINFSHQHDHDEKIHIANNLVDSHNLIGNHDEHGTKVFDIENDVIIKKQNQFSDLQVIFFLIVILVVCVSLSLFKKIRPELKFTFPFQRLYYKSHPLRAPPHLA